jgi:SAM-dependent methyltransferase
MIDYRKMRRIIDASTNDYYEQESCRFEQIAPLVPRIDDVIRRAARPEHRVLDIGCGNGRTLIRNAPRFAEGIGLDNSERYLRQARGHAAGAGVRNVRFVEGLAAELPFEDGSFDLVFSERGPLAWSDVNIGQAMRVLRPGGWTLAETGGAANYREPGLIFDPDWSLTPCTTLEREEKARAFFDRNGVDVRLVSSWVRERVFADFYEWLKWHLSQWEYYGDWRFDRWPLPDEWKAGIERFLAAVGDDAGRVHIRSHQMWIGGVKP